MINGVEVDVLFEFDPANIERLFAQDLAVENGWTTNLLVHPKQYKRTDNELAVSLKALRNALLLPLGDRMLWFLHYELAEAEQEARTRAEKAEKARRNPYRSEWASANLIGEVEAVAGEGKRHGKKWWFHCPFGTHTDTTPSLEVDPVQRIWHCFGCDRKGGVVDWRKLVESRVTLGYRL